MSERENESSGKIPRLEKSDDYILWKRRLYAYIHRYGAEVIGFELEPSSNSPSVRKKWFELTIRAKSIIVLSLGDSPLAKVRHLIDDDSISGKQLWDELETIYTASNAQVILNLRQDMDELRYKEGTTWDDHVNKFTELLNKLATYDEDLTEKDKASRLLRTIPQSFSGFAMIAQVQELQFERLIQAMHAEISRRQSVKTSNLNRTPNASIATMGSQVNGRSTRGGLISKHRSQGNDTCYVCGKNGHYAVDCWHRANRGGHRGRGRGGFRGRRGRGRGRGRGFRQYGHPYGTQRLGPGPASQYPTGLGYGNNWNNESGNQGFGTEQQQPQANPQQVGFPPRRPSISNHSTSYQGFIARIKFRSSIASVSIKRSDEALIDCGATHNFFNSKKFFYSYEEFDEEVRSASGTSRIVGVGQIFLPLDGDVFIEGYHVPNFAESILSVHCLSTSFDIVFKTYGSTNTSSCQIYRRNAELKVFETETQGGLYKMALRKRQNHEVNSSQTCIEEFETSHCLICAAVVHSSVQGPTRPTSFLFDNKPLEWHNRAGHPSPSRYARLTQTFEDIPYFSRSTMEGLLCVPCQLGKARRAKITRTPDTIAYPLELVHTDIAGPVTASTGGSIYSLCFMDSFTAKSDVFFLKKKSDLLKYLIEYKTKSELDTGHVLHKLRLDGAGENMSRTVEQFCAKHGIKLEPSPSYAHQSNGTDERLNQEFWARTRVLLFASKLLHNL